MISCEWTKTYHIITRTILHAPNTVNISDEPGIWIFQFIENTLAKRLFLGILSFARKVYP